MVALHKSWENNPYSIQNPQGASPVLLICDHASAFIPPEFAALGLPADVLDAHITHDIGIREVTSLLAAKLDATAIYSEFSRVLIDANRRPDEPVSIPEASDGIAIPGNQNLSEEARELRQNRYFRPYHRAIESLLRDREGRGQPTVILSMHSFTPQLRTTEAPRPWHIGILWNEDDRLSRPMIAHLSEKDIVVGDNEPYSGKDPVGYSLKIYGDQMGYATIGIEIRQDLIAQGPGQSLWAGHIIDACTSILDAAQPHLYQKMPKITIGA